MYRIVRRAILAWGPWGRGGRGGRGRSRARGTDRMSIPSSCACIFMHRMYVRSSQCVGCSCLPPGPRRANKQTGAMKLMCVCMPLATGHWASVISASHGGSMEVGTSRPGVIMTALGSKEEEQHHMGAPSADPHRVRTMQVRRVLSSPRIFRDTVMEQHLEEWWKCWKR